MTLVAQAIAAAVMLLHVYIFVGNGVVSRLGPKVFGISKEDAIGVGTAMSNQGATTAFWPLALALGFVLPNPPPPRRLPYSACVRGDSGHVGAATVNRRILLVQTVPAVRAGVDVIKPTPPAAYPKSATPQAPAG